MGAFDKCADGADSRLDSLSGSYIVAGVELNFEESVLGEAMAHRYVPSAGTYTATSSVLFYVVLFVVIVAQSLHQVLANAIDFSTIFPVAAVVADGGEQRQRVNVREIARMVASGAGGGGLRAILAHGVFRGMKTHLFRDNSPLRRKMDVGVQNTLQEIPCGASDSDGMDDEAAGSSDGTCDSTMLVADVRWAFHVCVAGGEYQNVGLVVQSSSAISLTQIGKSTCAKFPTAVVNACKKAHMGSPDLLAFCTTHQFYMYI